MNYTLDAGAFAPEYAHDTDAGMDLRSPINVIIPPRAIPFPEAFCTCTPGCMTIDTGVHVQLPPGTVGFLKSKSGLNVNHAITSEGVIDQGYTGSIVVKLYNHSDKNYTINVGDKITQLVVLPVVHVDLEHVESLENTDRGAAGFGSTGK